jgi:hypothetical protein
VLPSVADKESPPVIGLFIMQPISVRLQAMLADRNVRTYTNQNPTNMSYKKCVVVGCNVIQTPGSGVSMKTFPWGNAGLAQKWIVALETAGTPRSKVTRTSRVCLSHFKPGDFVPSVFTCITECKFSSQVLSYNTIPTLKSSYFHLTSSQTTQIKCKQCFAFACKWPSLYWIYEGPVIISYACTGVRQGAEEHHLPLLFIIFLNVHQRAIDLQDGTQPECFNYLSRLGLSLSTKILINISLFLT